MLLLDEPTAHLDEPTANAVLQTIRDLDRTVIHITHRPEETQHADLVLEIDGTGRVRALAST